MKHQIIGQILEQKLIAIVRGVYGTDCLKLAKALYAGGIGLMEVTFDQSRQEDHKKTADTVKLLCREMGAHMAVGTGTVTSARLVELSAQAGAEFIISPDVNGEVIQETGKAGLVSIPGAMTPTEILTAHRAGADFVKVFPASGLGASYIKAVRGPINQIPLLAVGGVNETNIQEFLKAGCGGAGVGGNLVNREWIRQGRFGEITELAGKFIRNSR